MNKKHGFLFGFAVIAIAAIFTLAGCDDGSGDDPNGDDKGGGGKALSSIAIKVDSTHKTAFFVGDKFDTTGLALYVSYTDGSNEGVSTGFTTDPTHDTELTEASSSKTVTVSYTSGGVTKTATYTIKVKEPVTKADFQDVWTLADGRNPDYVMTIDNSRLLYKDGETTISDFVITSWGDVVPDEYSDTISITFTRTTSHGYALAQGGFFGGTDSNILTIYMRIDSYGELTFASTQEFSPQASWYKTGSGSIISFERVED